VRVKTKTSITLPADVLSSIDELDPNRSAFLERAARAYLSWLERERRDRRDAEIVNSLAERLNREATDVLEYQGQSPQGPAKA